MTLFVLIRGSLMRPRYDQVMNFGWKVCLPITLLNLFGDCFCDFDGELNVCNFKKNTAVGMFTIVRSMWMVNSHALRPRDTILYPEQPVPVPPRFRGRIVLTRDPDGDERCVACNLCAVACPVGCISLQKAEREDGRWYPEFFSHQF